MMRILRRGKLSGILTCGVLVVVSLSSGTLRAQSDAQDLTRMITVGADSVKVQLESRDVGCRLKKQIELGKIFCFHLRLTTANPNLQRDLKLEAFDAQMPAHRHGMVTRAAIQAKNLSEYFIEGVKLHMSGEWSITLKILTGKTTSQVAIPLKL